MKEGKRYYKKIYPLYRTRSYGIWVCFTQSNFIEYFLLVHFHMKF